MDRAKIESLLNEVREGRTAVSDALDRLRDLPFEDIGFAKLDHHRALRTGMPEVIFAAGKTTAQVAAIFARMAQAGGNVLATRATREMYEAVSRSSRAPSFMRPPAPSRSRRPPPRPAREPSPWSAPAPATCPWLKRPWSRRG
jgi:hypothetical protein